MHHTTEPLLEFFSSHSKHQYKKGELIIRADEIPGGIYFLESGTVKQYVISQKGEELVLNIFKPHAFFPMSYAFTENNNEYYYEALSDLTAYKAPVHAVLSFIQTHHEVLYDLLKRVFIGIDGLEKRLMYLMAGSAYTRLITELVIQSKRFGEESEHGINIHLNETELAARSGMTRETVSREVRHLKEIGLIDIYKSKLYIKNLQLLENEISEGV